MLISNCVSRNKIICILFFDLIHFRELKVSRSRNKIVEPPILPKNKAMNLFLGESAALQFCFEIFETFRAEIRNYFRSFLIQIKTLKFGSEIYWPLLVWQNQALLLTPFNSLVIWKLLFKQPTATHGSSRPPKTPCLNPMGPNDPKEFLL